MVTTEKDNDGKVIAYCEYQVVNEKGLQDPQGLYCWVNDIWLHETYKIFKKIINKMINNELLKYPQVTWLYFKRTKHKERMKMYKVRKML